MFGSEKIDGRKMVLLYSSNDDFREELYPFLKILVPESDLVVGKTQEELLRILGLSRTNFIAVLFVSSQKELSQLVSLQDHLRGAKIILVLPDREKQTIAEGHQLQPRFLTFANGDLGEVKAVLGKMLSTA
ncbi:MAG: hypothetical protein PHE84_00440 [bacterium]|nr:hypothetical protein [bacterium]